MAPHRAEYDESDASSQSQESHEDQRERGKEHVYFLHPEDELRSGVISLNLARSFARHWTPSEAFRDLFQNWRDASMATFGLKHDDLWFKIDKPKSNYEIKLYSRKLRRFVGYIRHNKNTNSLDITNYEAHLTRENFSLGGSTKAKNPDLAGNHGEGLKTASIVMVRNGYTMSIETSGLRLHFEFCSKEPTAFVCRIRKVHSSALQKKEKEYKERRPGDFSSTLPESNFCGDVTVIIKNVEFVEFERWLKFCLDLEDKLDVIETSRGSIILDPAFRGRIYLKGLLLRNHSPIETRMETVTGPVTQYKYGYNILEGEVNRDRRSLANSEEEENLIFQIWMEAIINEIDKPVKRAVKHFVSLLLEAEKHRWADGRIVALYCTSYRESSSGRNGEGSQRTRPQTGNLLSQSKKCRQGKEYDVETIESLGRKPVQLPSSIWDPLSELGIIWTPQEEQCRLLQRAYTVDIESNPFSETVRRTLFAAFALDERTRHLKLLCKAGDKADLDLLLDNSTVLIHQRSFDFNACHARSQCQITEHALAESSRKDYNHRPFLCDHVVIYLYGLLLKQLMPGSCYGGQTATDHHLCTKVSEFLQQMPRNVEIAQGSQQGTIKVSWVDIASEIAKLNGFDLKCRVTLHETTCQGKKEEFLAQESIPENGCKLYFQDTAECGCPKQVVLQKDSKAIFGGLDLEKEYYPWWLARARKPFTHLPPKLCAPNRLTAILSTFTGDSPCHYLRLVQAVSENTTVMWIFTAYLAAEKTIWMLIHPRQAHIRENMATEQCRCSPIQIEQLNVVSDKVRPVVRGQQDRGVPVDSSGGDRNNPENAKENRDARAAANPVHAGVRQTMETPGNAEEERPSNQYQTQKPHSEQMGQPARARACTPRQALDDQLLIQQLQAENGELQAELTASKQNSTSIRTENGRLRAELARAKQHGATAYKQGYTAALCSMRDTLDKRLASRSSDGQPPDMAGRSRPAETQGNASSAELKRGIIQDGEESNEHTAKKLKQG